MARIVIVGMFACFTLIASPAQAGDLWAWIKELSGPGPFNGLQFDVRLACFGNLDKAYSDDQTAHVSLTDAGDRLVPAAVTVSLCPANKRRGRFAVGTVVRDVDFTDTSPTNAYAGGNKIRLFTWSGTFTIRPVDGIAHRWGDWIDIGAGVGWYRFTSDTANPGGFSPLNGLLIEPIHFEIHFPSAIASAEKWSWLPFVQVNWVMFASGFDAGAFGPNLVPPKSNPIPKTELVRNVEVFTDLTWAINKLWRR